MPIITVSSFAMKGNEEKLRASGCDDYLTKPYSPADLLCLVRRYLEETAAYICIVGPVSGRNVGSTAGIRGELTSVVPQPRVLRSSLTAGRYSIISKGRDDALFAAAASLRRALPQTMSFTQPHGGTRAARSRSETTLRRSSSSVRMK